MALFVIVNQRDFRGRNDDGTESTATWIAAKNTNWTQAQDTNFRLRYAFPKTASGTVWGNTHVVAMQYNRNGLGWNNITNASSVVRLSTSPNVTDETATTQQISSPDTFQAGNVLTSSTSTTNLIGGAGSTYELEICAQIRSADTILGDTIQIRIWDSTGGVAADTITNTVTITVAAGVGTPPPPLNNTSARMETVQASLPDYSVVLLGSNAQETYPQRRLVAGWITFNNLPPIVNFAQVNLPITLNQTPDPFNIGWGTDVLKNPNQFGSLYVFPLQPPGAPFRDVETRLIIANLNPDPTIVGYEPWVLNYPPKASIPGWSNDVVRPSKIQQPWLLLNQPPDPLNIGYGPNVLHDPYNVVQVTPLATPPAISQAVQNLIISLNQAPDPFNIGLGSNVTKARWHWDGPVAHMPPPPSYPTPYTTSLVIQLNNQIPDPINIGYGPFTLANPRSASNLPKTQSGLDPRTDLANQSLLITLNQPTDISTYTAPKRNLVQPSTGPQPTNPPLSVQEMALFNWPPDPVNIGWGQDVLTSPQKVVQPAIPPYQPYTSIAVKMEVFNQPDPPIQIGFNPYVLNVGKALKPGWSVDKPPQNAALSVAEMEIINQAAVPDVMQQYRHIVQPIAVVAGLKYNPGMEGLGRLSALTGGMNG